MTPRVAILDYGCGNLASVANAVRKVGGEPFTVGNWFGHWPTVDEPQPTHVLMPGQGHFGEAMKYLTDMRWMADWARERNIPILGICLGMQLMCEGSDEAPGVKGLGWLPYPVRRLSGPRLPHIGWNTVTDLGNEAAEQDYYFCHSYAVGHGPNGDPWVSEDHSWLTGYEDELFVSMIQRDNLWAVQFHPEKSGRAGLALLAEFLRL